LPCERERLRNFVAFLTAAVGASSADAALYKCIAPDGQISYLQEPCSKADYQVDLSKPPSPEARKAADALTVLTATAYLTGAADSCKVALSESRVLSGVMAISIDRGNYGKPAQAHVDFNTARQQGITDHAAGKVECAKVRGMIEKYGARAFANEVPQP